MLNGQFEIDLGGRLFRQPFEWLVVVRILGVSVENAGQGSEELRGSITDEAATITRVDRTLVGG